LTSSNEICIQIRNVKYTDENLDLKIMMGPGANAPHFLILEKVMKVRRFDFMLPLSSNELML